MKTEQKHLMLYFFSRKLNLVVKLVTTGSKYSKLSVEQYFCRIRSCQRLYSRSISSISCIFNNSREDLLLKQFLIHPLKTSQRKPTEYRLCEMIFPVFWHRVSWHCLFHMPAGECQLQVKLSFPTECVHWLLCLRCCCGRAGESRKVTVCSRINHPLLFIYFIQIFTGVLHNKFHRVLTDILI